MNEKLPDMTPHGMLFDAMYHKKKDIQQTNNFN